MVIYAFSLIIFLVLPLKKSDKVMNDKRLTKSYKSHNEPQSSHCSIVHKDTHLSYERYKIKKPCSKGLPKVHKYQYTQTHTIFVFFRFFPPFFLFKVKKIIKKTHTHTHTHTHKHKQTNKQKQKTKQTNK